MKYKATCERYKSTRMIGSWMHSQVQGWRAFEMVMQLLEADRTTGTCLAHTGVLHAPELLPVYAQ